MRVITAILFALMITGIIMLIVNERLNWLDTSYEIIAFTLGSFGMILAVVEQINSYQNEKRFHRMFSEIKSLNREHDDDEKVDKVFQKKLDTLLEMDYKIYRKIAKK